MSDSAGIGLPIAGDADEHGEAAEGKDRAEADVDVRRRRSAGRHIVRFVRVITYLDGVPHFVLPGPVELEDFFVFVGIHIIVDPDGLVDAVRV